MVKERHDIAHLEKNIKHLVKSLKSLTADDDLAELLKIIHQPGWTTPAELVFTLGMVDVIQQQVESIAGMRKTLLEGSRKVGMPG